MCEICSKFDVVLLSLLLTLNRFHTLFWCFYWFWTSKCRIGIEAYKSCFVISMSFSSKKLGIIRKNDIKYFVWFFSNTEQKNEVFHKGFFSKVTKSADSCGFSHIYWKKSLTENFIVCAVKVLTWLNSDLSKTCHCQNPRWRRIS